MGFEGARRNCDHGGSKRRVAQRGKFSRILKDLYRGGLVVNGEDSLAKSHIVKGIQKPK
jgi:hypothetical protein